MKKIFEDPGIAQNQEVVSHAVSRVQGMGINFAETYLEEGDPLREYIIQYYSDTERLGVELNNVFKGLDESEISKRIDAIEQKFTDPKYFIELFEKVQERNASMARVRKRAEKQPMATDLEYDAGVYYEGLERQVADAVFELRQKGYNTFQSGFTEKYPRDQYIDVYNKEVNIPGEIVEDLERLGFEVVLKKQADRTTIRIHPTKDTAVRLTEWKDVWNMFASKMPKATPEDFSTVRIYELKRLFQERQNKLRTSA